MSSCDCHPANEHHHSRSYFEPEVDDDFCLLCGDTIDNTMVIRRCDEYPDRIAHDACVGTMNKDWCEQV